MKRQFVYLFIFCFCCAPFVFCGENPRITVLTYNIHHGEGNDGKLNLPRIAEIVKSVKPDLVGLQEVDVKTDRVNGVDQAKVLGDLTGMFSFFARAIPYSNGEYGDAVLVNRNRLKEILKSRKELPYMEGREQRVCIESIVQLKEGDGQIRFYNTHLDHLRDELNRLPSAKAINEWNAKDGVRWDGTTQIEFDVNIPSILVGDMNAVPDSNTIREFQKYWTVAGEGDAMFSFSAEKPNRRIDYIMYRPAKRWRVIETKVLDEKVASDHRPMMAVFELLPEE